MNTAGTPYFCSAIRDGSTSHPWILLERTASGARLLVEDPDRVPDRFTLVQKNPVAIVRKCRVVWRSGAHIGVTFECGLAPEPNEPKLPQPST